MIKAIPKIALVATKLSFLALVRTCKRFTTINASVGEQRFVLPFIFAFTLTVAVYSKATSDGLNQWLTAQSAESLVSRTTHQSTTDTPRREPSRKWKSRIPFCCTVQ